MSTRFACVRRAGASGDAHLVYVACVARGSNSAYAAALAEVSDVRRVALEQLEHLMGGSLFMPVCLYLWHTIGQ